MGYRTIFARYLPKICIAQFCLCQTKCQGGVSHHSGGVLTSLNKYRAIWGIAAIVSHFARYLGPATTQNLVVKFDGEICGGVSVENASDDFPQ